MESCSKLSIFSLFDSCFIIAKRNELIPSDTSQSQSLLISVCIVRINSAVFTLTSSSLLHSPVPILEPHIFTPSLHFVNMLTKS